MKSSSNSGSLWQLGLQSGSLKALAIGRILWSLFQFRNTFSMLERAQELTKFPSFFQTHRAHENNEFWNAID